MYFLTIFIMVMSFNYTLSLFDYYMGETVDEFYAIQPDKDGLLDPIYFIASRYIQRTTTKFKMKCRHDEINDGKTEEFYGCYLTNNYVDYGPIIIGDDLYNKMICGWDCKAKYKDHCLGERTLVGIAGAAACICLCDEIDIKTAEKVSDSQCAVGLNDVDTEISLVLGFKRVVFRAMAVCKPRLWGVSCQATCNCVYSICNRNNGVCLKGICKAGYTGKGCEIYDSCLQNNCQNGATCEVLSNVDYHCQCSTQTYGDKCEYMYDFADNKGTEDFKEDFDVMLEWMESGKQAEAINYENPTFFGCFERKSNFKEYTGFRSHSENFPMNCFKECKNNGKTLTFFTETQCFCGELLDIHVNKKEKISSTGFTSIMVKEMSVEDNECPRCQSNQSFMCTDYRMALYSSCKLNSYMYKGKCQNRCHCLRKVPCRIKDGHCPSLRCALGITGTTCNKENPEFVFYEGLEELDEGIKITHFTSIFTLLLFSFAVFSVFWSFKTCYNVFFVHPVNMKDLELEELSTPLNDDTY